MSSFKSFFASRTVWAALIGVLLQVATLAGVPQSLLPDVGQVVDAIMAMINGGLFLAAIVFRIVATKQIGRSDGISSPLGLFVVVGLSLAAASFMTGLRTPAWADGSWSSRSAVDPLSGRDRGGHFDPVPTLPAPAPLRRA